MPESRIPQNLLAAVVVSVSLVVCCWMLAGAVVRIKSTNEMIRVTGSARKPIRSDFIIWRGHISLRCKNVTQGYQDLKTDMDKAKRYLNASGVVDSEITTSAIEMTTLYAKTKHITLRQFIFHNSNIEGCTTCYISFWYRRPLISVVHCQSPFAIKLACKSWV